MKPKPSSGKLPLSARVNRASPQAVNRRINRKTEAVQNAILDAAAQVFAQKGYHLTKLADISDVLEMHVTALRYHFATKDVIAAELVNRVARRNLSELQAALAALPPEASVRDRLSVAIDTYIRTLIANRLDIAAHGNVINQLPEDARTSHYELLQSFHAIWRALLGEAAEKGELPKGLSPSIATQVLLGALIWTREWYRPNGATAAEISTQMRQMLFDGLFAAKT